MNRKGTISLWAMMVIVGIALILWQLSSDDAELTIYYPQSYNVIYPGFSQDCSMAEARLQKTVSARSGSFTNCYKIEMSEDQYQYCTYNDEKKNIREFGVVEGKVNEFVVVNHECRMCEPGYGPPKLNDVFYENEYLCITMSGVDPNGGAYKVDASIIFGDEAVQAQQEPVAGTEHSSFLSRIWSWLLGLFGLR